MVNDPHRPRCSGITETGKPCRQFRNGSQFCPAHDPSLEAAVQRRELARAGGRASGKVRRAKAEAARALEPVRIDGPEDAVALVVDTVNDVRLGRIDPARARIVLKGAAIILQHSSTRDLAGRIEALETKVREHGLDDPEASRSLFEAVRDMRRRRWRTGE